MISKEGLRKFMQLYERKYGISLSKEEALILFSHLIRIVKIGTQKRST